MLSKITFLKIEICYRKLPIRPKKTCWIIAILKILVRPQKPDYITAIPKIPVWFQKTSLGHSNPKNTGLIPKKNWSQHSNPKNTGLVQKKTDCIAALQKYRLDPNNPIISLQYEKHQFFPKVPGGIIWNRKFSIRRQKDLIKNCII